MTVHAHKRDCRNHTHLWCYFARLKVVVMLEPSLQNGAEFGQSRKIFKSGVEF